MKLQRVFLRSVTTVASLGFVIAPDADAQVRDVYRQQQVLFEWSGRVNRELEILVRGYDVTMRSAIGEMPNQRVVSRNSVPPAEGMVSIQMLSGRGNVSVVQQPSSRNDYVTVIRISDPQTGVGDYRFSARWTPRDGVYGNDPYGNDPYGRGGRYDCDYYDRDRDDGYGVGSAGGRGNGVGRGRGNANGRGNGNGRGNANGRGGWGGQQDRYDDCYNDDDYGYGRGGAMRWTGNVDNVIEIRIQGQNVRTVTLTGAAPRNVRANVLGTPLPRRNVEVRVNETLGRGTVRVVQQPNSRNGYTALIRVHDVARGFGAYDFRVIW